VEGEGSGEMGGEVDGVVAAWVEMKFMGDAARREDFIERGRTCVKAIVVL